MATEGKDLMYLVIESSGSDISIRQYTKEDLEAYLNGGDVCTHQDFFDEIPIEPDPTCWYDGICIIKGKVVVPKFVAISVP